MIHVHAGGKVEMPESIIVKSLVPTQIAVGMKLVKWKAKRLRKLNRKPQELVDFILENPLRVVMGPESKAYVIDHHHLGLALQQEGYKTAPMLVEADLSNLAAEPFWQEMAKRRWVHPFDGNGQQKKIGDLPPELDEMEDDPYRSLAGFVRYGGGFQKTATPYMEFEWADYFRPLIKRRQLASDFEDAVSRAVKLAHAPAAAHLPGYIGGALRSQTAASGKDEDG